MQISPTTREEEMKQTTLEIVRKTNCAEILRNPSCMSVEREGPLTYRFKGFFEGYNLGLENTDLYVNPSPGRSCECIYIERSPTPPSGPMTISSCKGDCVDKCPVYTMIRAIEFGRKSGIKDVRDEMNETIKRFLNPQDYP